MTKKFDNFEAIFNINFLAEEIVKLFCNNFDEIRGFIVKLFCNSTAKNAKKIFEIAVKILPYQKRIQL